MTNWVIHREFLRTKRECFSRLLNMVPPKLRAPLAKEIKAKAYMSAIRYFLRANLPAWPDVMIEDFGGSLIHDYTSIRNARGSLSRMGRGEYDPLKQHWVDSLETIQRAFRSARPSGAGVEAVRTSGKTHKLGSVMSVGRPQFKIALSPAYKRTTDRIGTTTYKHYVILNGFVVLEPFEDGKVWCCEVEDAKERKPKTIYLGRHGDDFVAHSNLAACITFLEKVVTKKCMLAMRGEVEED